MIMCQVLRFGRRVCHALTGTDLQRMPLHLSTYTSRVLCERIVSKSCRIECIESACTLVRGGSITEISVTDGGR